MSKPSTRKKARRQKRLAQKVVWTRITDALDEFDEMPEPAVELAPHNVTEAILGVGRSLDDGYCDDTVDLVNQATRFEDQVAERGWVFYSELSTIGYATWYWVPSESVLPEGDMREQFTSVMLRIPDEGADVAADFPASVHVFLVGCDKSGFLHYQLSPGQFFEHIEIIEAYRLNDPPFVTPTSA